MWPVLRFYVTQKGTMKKGAMARVINLFEGTIYHNFTWMYLGLSGGCKDYKTNDFIPDKLTHIYKQEYN